MTDLERNREYVRELWRNACEHDGIEPSAMFVLLSDDNPFWQEYNNAIQGYMAMVKVFKETMPSVKTG